MHWPVEITRNTKSDENGQAGVKQRATGQEESNSWKKNKDWNILGGPKIHILSCRTQSLGNREADVKCETWEEWRRIGRDQGRREKSFCFRYIINHLIESH